MNERLSGTDVVQRMSKFEEWAKRRRENPIRPTCELCKFWDNSVQMQGAQSDTTGACRINPPKVHKMTGGAVWPFTEDTDWCGSFALDPKKDPDPEPEPF